MISQKNTVILAAFALLQCVASSMAATVTGQVTVDDFLGTGSLIIKFEDTEEGNLLVIESGELNAASYAFSTTEGGEESEPYQKISGLVDCVNTNTGDDNIVIVSGVTEGTAEDFWRRGLVDQFFIVGDRFMTAVDVTNEMLGEVSNLGQEGTPDSTDCMYFSADDFDLRPVASGYLELDL
jgi:hypothetical protein